MTTDDRPSIAELQRQEQEGRPNAAPTPIRRALPALLEIAKAALEHEAARQAFEWSAANQDRPVFEGKRLDMQQAHRDLLAALAKVRP